MNPSLPFPILSILLSARVGPKAFRASKNWLSNVCMSPHKETEA